MPSDLSPPSVSTCPRGSRRGLGRIVALLAGLLAAACVQAPRYAADEGGSALSPLLAEAVAGTPAAVAVAECDRTVAERNVNEDVAACRTALAEANAAGIGEAGVAALRVRLGAAELAAERPQLAVAQLGAATDSLLRLVGPQHPETRKAQQLQVTALLDTGAVEPAFGLLASMLAAAPPVGDGGQQDLGTRLFALRERGHALRGVGRWQEAEQSYRDAAETATAMLGDGTMVPAVLNRWAEAAQQAGESAARRAGECTIRGNDSRRCRRIGTWGVGDPLEDAERGLGRPAQTRANADGSETRIYALPASLPPAPTLVLTHRDGQVLTVQLTGRQLTEPHGMASVFLGDFQPAVLRLLGQPTRRITLRETGRESWQWPHAGIAIEMQGQRVYSMKVSRR